MDLLKANGVDINSPHKYFEWSVVIGQDEHGNQHQHIEPVTKTHESARVQAEGGAIEYDRIIAERAAAVAESEEKTEQLEQQDSTLLALMARLEKLEANSVPLTSMSPPQLKGIAKRRGLDATGLRCRSFDNAV